MFRLGGHFVEAARDAAGKMILGNKDKLEFEYARGKYFVATSRDCTCDTLLGLIAVEGKTVYICLPKRGVTPS